uniref:Uncharacterized protein n=1 Tax=Timema douglasi TaxID=61478 RepID=A0A7R8VY67_TIMDO|nr:unnamed protein product [Timema douglasi]
MRDIFAKARMVKEGITSAISSKCRIGHTADYQEAVKILNTLQTNAAVLQENRKRGKASHNVQATNIADTAKYLSRLCTNTCTTVYTYKGAFCPNVVSGNPGYLFVIPYLAQIGGNIGGGYSM